MRVRLDDVDGHLAADWTAVFRTDETGRVILEWIERQVNGGVDCMSLSRAVDLFALLSTRSRPVSDKVTVLKPR